MSSLHRFFAAIFLCLLVHAPLYANSFENEIAKAIEGKIAQTLGVRVYGYSSATIDQTLMRWYEERSFVPFWTSAKGPGQKAREVRQAIINAYEHGLRPEDYFLSFIEARWNKSDARSLAELEVFLTLGAGRLITDAQVGRLEPQVADKTLFEGVRWDAPNLGAHVKSMLYRHDIGSAIAEQYPRHAQYELMKKALFEYRTLKKKGGWGRLPPGPTLKKGDQSPRVYALKEILQAQGDLKESQAGSDVFDDETASAVMLFQERHGLPTTGEVHDLTMEALHVPVEAREAILLINLERWRWLGRDFSKEKEVFVNIAGYELFALEQGKLRIRLPVIVGKSFHATPVFTGTLKYIEVNPYWNIPLSIARNEILPKLQTDPHYLVKQHMQLYQGTQNHHTELSSPSIPWQTMSARDMNRYSIRQTPGPWNVLGELKFVFPNPYSVFLHDTSSRQLFAQRERAFSHGCIRVGSPKKLAAFLMDTEHDPWDVSRITAQITEGKNKNLQLPTPVTIHLTYRTAWVELDGSVHFRRDLYNRDARLLAAIGHS